MGVRISDRPRSSNVIALHPRGFGDTAEDDSRSPELCYERSGDGLSVAVPGDAPLPEPVQLYGLTVLAFLLHTPTPGVRRRRCVRCETRWPCDHLRLAYRLREGF
jgi:hypothetical protein